MKKGLIGLFCIAVTTLLLLGSAFGSQITSASDPALSGASIINFENQTAGIYGSLTIDNVTFTANNNHLQIDGYFAGNYNTTGRLYLDNGTYSNEGFSSMTFTFSGAVSAFGFNWGASNESWVLNAYDASNNLLESFALPITLSSNAGEFYGLADAGIAYATLSNTSGYDWIFIDNFKSTAAVPLPAGLWLLGTGLFGLLGIRQKFQK
jgi:hypothetical protein